MAASRWCYTIEKSSVKAISQLQHNQVESSSTACQPNRWFEECACSLTSSCRASRDTTDAGVRETRHSTLPGCSNSGGNDAPHTVFEEVDHRRISLAELPCFTPVVEHSRPLRPHVQFHPAAPNADQRQVQADVLEMSTFVDALMQEGILAQQQLRWGRSRACKLQLTANKTLSWTSGRYSRRSSTIDMTEVAAVHRAGRKVILQTCKPGPGSAFTLASEADAVLFECVLLPMCTTASMSILDNKGSTIRGGASAAKTCSSSIGSSSSSSSSSSRSSNSRRSVSFCDCSLTRKNLSMQFDSIFFCRRRCFEFRNVHLYRRYTYS
jgi:hypothetical protein